ncbi:Nif3-like dinuclear metal center hexameric protein [Jongsikchunia kroppenstedtii]|uniref:Nif3-like dinuclear metal center hexameric protein n=1 Tax=Jongsikchunia kroppenstedtii TaxID=1121721 RepID=UPI00036E689A|nr:Nif3-like dinuclear metal center hexameric protein [Jongsikchunia kroppenstedtii]
MATVRDAIAVLETAYPPRLAESWDSVGLVCGDPDDPVESVLVCVDVTEAVVDAALGSGATLVVAHHPLLMRGVDTVGTHTPKGRLVHRLIRGGCALYTAHTNADSANPGVSDALAGSLGLVDLRPLDPKPVAPMDKWSVLVPIDDGAAMQGVDDRVSAAMFDAGAGSIGGYSCCAWSTDGHGQFLPGADAQPTLGEPGSLHRVPERRIDMVAPRGRRSAVLAALRLAHPYEEPAFDVLELASEDGTVGLGRVGRLESPMSLREFAARVSTRLRTESWGIRVAGDPDASVETVAVCGGAGDSLIDAARAAGVDVYLTGDLRHHPVDESLRRGGPAFIDAGHWGTEFPWCAQAQGILIDSGFAATVFGEPTHPWKAM